MPFKPSPELTELFLGLDFDKVVIGGRRGRLTTSPDLPGRVIRREPVYSYSGGEKRLSPAERLRVAERHFSLLRECLQKENVDIPGFAYFLVPKSTESDTDEGNFWLFCIQEMVEGVPIDWNEPRFDAWFSPLGRGLQDYYGKTRRGGEPYYLGDVAIITKRETQYMLGRLAAAPPTDLLENTSLTEGRAVAGNETLHMVDVGPILDCVADKGFTRSIGRAKIWTGGVAY